MCNRNIVYMQIQMHNNINLHTVTQHNSIRCAFYEHFQNACLQKHTHDHHINTHTCIQIQKHTRTHSIHLFSEL